MGNKASELKKAGKTVLFAFEEAIGMNFSLQSKNLKDLNHKKKTPKKSFQTDVFNPIY